MVLEKKDYITIAKLLLDYVPPMIKGLLDVMEAELSKETATEEVKAATEAKKARLLEAVKVEPGKQPGQ